ncbi:4Fe-4S dicluster domain-containing protein [Alloiococcus sp. CFN-8]|uniref:4Fe-4S dicluster domain-containing protein n=1 Tax=Alloiococcus sp. CFN-8 TaxID=3416081 RepID=UPI003CF01840
MGLFKREKVLINNRLDSLNLEVIDAGEEVVYNLILGNDNVYKPTVKVGDEIEVGMAIAKSTLIPEGFLYSSVSGKVKKLIDSYDYKGRKTAAILIENNKVNSVYNGLTEGHNDKISLLEGLKKYHLLDTKGNELYHNYNRDLDEVTTIIYNATHWDSSTLATPYHLNASTKEILEAVNVLKDTYKNASIFFVFDKASSYNFEKLERTCTSVHFKLVDKSYGYDMSSLLVKENFPKESERSVIVDEFKSLMSIYKAVCLNEPITEEIVSVSVNDSFTKLIKVKIGTKIKDIATALDIKESDYQKVIRNGVISGKALVSTEVSVNQGTASIDYVQVKGLDKERACIRCGACVRVCPVQLYPMELVKHSNKNTLDNFKKYKGMDCVECGLCSYYCPSKISLAHRISLGKSYLTKV